MESIDSRLSDTHFKLLLNTIVIGIGFGIYLTGYISVVGLLMLTGVVFMNNFMEPFLRRLRNKARPLEVSEIKALGMFEYMSFICGSICLYSSFDSRIYSLFQ